MKKYELYHKDTHIGSLIETNWDMRSFGEISYQFNFLAEFPQDFLLADYIKHSIKASNFLEECDEENYNKICEEENSFLDLIHSSEWKLLDMKGETIKILCPIFHEDGVTWQLDLDK